jgi:hypothetical protein
MVGTAINVRDAIGEFVFHPRGKWEAGRQVGRKIKKRRLASIVAAFFG